MELYEAEADLPTKGPGAQELSLSESRARSVWSRCEDPPSLLKTPIVLKTGPSANSPHSGHALTPSQDEGSPGRMCSLLLRARVGESCGQIETRSTSR